jgi:ribosomal protein L2
MDSAAQGQEAKSMTLQEEKEALKRRLKEIDNKFKKQKYKKEPKDILNDPKGKSPFSLIVMP